MKELLQQYAGYNIWATQKIVDALAALTDEQAHLEIESSFSSIFKTVLHMWDAESIWWQRVKLAETINIPSENFTDNFTALQLKLIEQQKQWAEWITNSVEHQLLHVFAYQNSKREQFKQPVYQMLLHLFNHGTYHRGQLITLMRHAGVSKIPGTDFIAYTRLKK